MCIEKWIQRFFFPFHASWTAPVETLDALDAAVLRRMRYIAVCPLAVAAWALAALSLGGANASRLGTLGAGLMQATVLTATCAPRRGGEAPRHVRRPAAALARRALRFAMDKTGPP
jgi:hypothetical protein